MSVGVGEAYFEISGDVELKPTGTIDSDSSCRCITWRGDPDDTGSDCSITIVTNELQTNTYYVHKSIICFGSKQSKYFASQFIRNSGTTTLHDSNTRKNPAIKVELDQRDAENFPLFLDFVYKASEGQEFRCIKNKLEANGTMETLKSSFSSPSIISSIPSSSCDIDEVGSFSIDTDDITTKNAVSLRYLARRFENEALTLAVNKFIQKDLNFNNGPIYLSNAWEYKDQRLIESAQRLCVENITQIDMKALLQLSTNLFRIVVKSLESFEDENRELSLMLSDVVCRYLEHNPKSSTAELLLDLTDPLLMPYISADAAIGYTAIVKDLETDDVALHWDSLVRLCRRCAKAVVKQYGWSDFSVSTAVNEYLVSHSNKTKDELESVEKRSRLSAARVDSLLFATSFAAALEQAQDDYEDVLSTHDQFLSLIKQFDDSVEVMEKYQLRKDTYFTKQQHELRRARDEIRDLKRQIVDLQQQKQQSATLSQQSQQSRSNTSQISGNANENIGSESMKSKQKKNSEMPNSSKMSNDSRVDESTPTKTVRDSQTPPRHPDNQSSISNSSREQNRSQHARITSSPAPMARQRMYHHQISAIQTSNQNSRRDLLQSHSQSQKTMDSQSRSCERSLQDLNNGESRRNPKLKPNQRHHEPRPYDEPTENLRTSNQNDRQHSPPPSQQQEQLQRPQRQMQQHQAQAKRPRVKHHHLPSKGVQYKYHPDLLEMSFSEPVTTMDDGTNEADDDNNDDDDDSLFDIAMSFSSLGQDLISPSQVGVDIHNNKSEKRLELKTRNEMRSKSLLV